MQGSPGDIPTVSFQLLPTFVKHVYVFKTEGQILIGVVLLKKLGLTPEAPARLSVYELNLCFYNHNTSVWFYEYITSAYHTLVMHYS